MSIFGKKFVPTEEIKEEPVVANEPEVEEPVVEPAAEPVEEPAPEKIFRGKTTIIGVGTVFEGNIETSDNVEINGTMRGNIKSSADVAISGTGFYFGDANMANLNVDGRAEGNIDCEGHTVLTNTGYVKGSVISARLTTAEGAVIDGIMALNNKPKAEVRKEAPKAEELKAEEPKKEEPKAEEPKKEEPKAEPVKEDPKAEALFDEILKETEKLRMTEDVPEEITRYINSGSGKK